MAAVFIAKIDSKPIHETVLDALAWVGWKTIIPPQVRIFVKPNLTWPSHLPGVTTSPEVLEGIILALKTRSSNIIIGESDGGYHSFQAEEAFTGHGLYELAKRYGIELVNLSRLKSERVEMTVGSKRFQLELPSLLLHEIDVFITVPVPKVHAMTGVSLAFKNQWGCLPNIMRLREHPEFNEKIVAINKLLRPRIAIYDGTYFLDRNGPMAGEPVRMDLLIASNDIGAGDYVCCQIMNIDPTKIKHLTVAHKEGMLPPSLEEITLNDDITNFNKRKFRLERTLLNWIALMAFNSHWGTKLFYDSPLAKPLHKILYTMRRNPVIRRLLYKDFEPPLADDDE